MKVNTRPPSIFTHEGGKAVEVSPFERLKRTILATMLFEDNFYEDGMKAADRITELCGQCTCLQILMLAYSAALEYNLRHIPLQMIVEALKKEEKTLSKSFSISNFIENIITRPDMMTDLLALYWKNGRKPLANQLKKGLARAFTKFDRYQLSKYRHG